MSNGRSRAIPEMIRLDGYNHFPVIHKIPNATLGVQRKSRSFCEKCRLYLCLTGGKQKKTKKSVLRFFTPKSDLFCILIHYLKV